VVGDPRNAGPALFWSRFAAVPIARAPRTLRIGSSWMLPDDYPRSLRLDAGGHVAACTIDAREMGRTPDDGDPPRGPFRRCRCV
jgi:hypothetical protein